MSGRPPYKHFPSNDAVLTEMLVSISERLLRVGQEHVDAADVPADALRGLIAWHTEFALANRSLIVVQDRDSSSLVDEARELVRVLRHA